jgi:hypothetical protein
MNAQAMYARAPFRSYHLFYLDIYPHYSLLLVAVLWSKWVEVVYSCSDDQCMCVCVCVCVCVHRLAVTCDYSNNLCLTIMMCML